MENFNNKSTENYVRYHVTVISNLEFLQKQIIEYQIFNIFILQY